MPCDDDSDKDVEPKESSGWGCGFSLVAVVTIWFVISLAGLGYSASRDFRHNCCLRHGPFWEIEAAAKLKSKPMQLELVGNKNNRPNTELLPLTDEQFKSIKDWGYVWIEFRSGKCTVENHR